MRAPGLTHPDAAQALGRITRLAARLFHAPAAWLALPDGLGEAIAAPFGTLPPRIPREHGIAARLSSRDGFLAVADLDLEDGFVGHPLGTGGSGLRSMAAAPVPGPDGTLLGALCIGAKRPRTFGAEDAAALRDLAALAGAEAARRAASGPSGPRALLPDRARLAEELAMLAGGTGTVPHLAVLVQLDHAAQAADLLSAPGCSAEELVCKAADIVEGVLPAGTALYRLGGARLAFLLPERAHRPVLDRLAGALRVPVACGTVPVLLSPRIGAVPFLPGRQTADALLRAASAAAHGAPGTGGHEGWSLYDAEADRAQARALRLLSDLHPALGARDPVRAGQIALHYQPRMDLRTGRCASVEALLRWDHPVLGGVPPGELMPLVERTALPRALTTWVLERALADAARWRAEGHALGVSVNVSAPNLAEPDFAARIGQLLDRHRLPPGMLELELTEDALLQGARLRRTLNELSSLGVTLAIDDFGTGYSNLAYLQRLPVGVLKLDRGFVGSLPRSERDRTIVQSLIAMAHALELRVVAEGVEDESTLALLRAWSCDEAQGFLFSPAMPLDALPGWIESNGRGWATSGA